MKGIKGSKRLLGTFQLQMDRLFFRHRESETHRLAQPEFRLSFFLSADFLSFVVTCEINNDASDSVSSHAR